MEIYIQITDLFYWQLDKKTPLIPKIEKNAEFLALSICKASIPLPCESYKYKLNMIKDLQLSHCTS